jgi:hypothetical protein
MNKCLLSKAARTSPNVKLMEADQLFAVLTPQPCECPPLGVCSQPGYFPTYRIVLKLTDPSKWDASASATMEPSTAVEYYHSPLLALKNSDWEAAESDVDAYATEADSDVEETVDARPTWTNVKEKYKDRVARQLMSWYCSQLNSIPEDTEIVCRKDPKLDVLFATLEYDYLGAHNLVRPKRRGATTELEWQPIVAKKSRISLGRSTSKALEPAETPKSVEVPKSVEAPRSAEIPKPAAVEVPKPVPIEVPNETPAEVPKPVPIEVPNETPVPAEVPKPVPVEVPNETPDAEVLMDDGDEIDMIVERPTVDDVVRGAMAFVASYRYGRKGEDALALLDGAWSGDRRFALMRRAEEASMNAEQRAAYVAANVGKFGVL